MDKIITVWKDGTYKTWREADAHYAANDENWLVNIPTAKPTGGIAGWLAAWDTLNLSQFTIDWQEETIDELEEVDNPKDEVGALRYEVENILQVLKPDLPDVEFFNEVLAYLGEFNNEPARPG